MITDAIYGGRPTVLVDGAGNIPMHADVATNPDNLAFDRLYDNPSVSTIGQENIAMQVNGPMVASNTATEGSPSAVRVFNEISIPATISRVSIF